MDILLFCPAGVATGGTESIHNLAAYLIEAGAHAKILYVGKNIKNPQPPEYKMYGVPYTIEYPKNYKGCIIFPEVWADQVLLPRYKNNVVAVNWQGYDVYSWHTPEPIRWRFLQRKDVIHIANFEYAYQSLKAKGLEPIRINEVLNDEFYKSYGYLPERSDTVLYNPVEAKLTDFQKEVMYRCDIDHRIHFHAIKGYSRKQVIDLFRHHILYLDLGEFSGRERLPREAIMCGTCIITSKTGAAGFYQDNPIPDKYKVSTVDEAVNMIRYVLANYKRCQSDFDTYRKALIQDKLGYPKDAERVYNAILNHNSSI